MRTTGEHLNDCYTLKPVEQREQPAHPRRKHFFATSRVLSRPSKKLVVRTNRVTAGFDAELS